MEQYRGTTIVSVRRNGKVAIAGDGTVDPEPRALFEPGDEKEVSLVPMGGILPDR